ncbi:uncharacterized protein LOC112516167 [Cynara cardunculus var. scolymus]|uniref:uncharacterized protein LOC112516167 n=1 Tax=Cynara cardunculus var. scolymus TaxID=59895 RepID=UPI000D625A59|nr:uncharacterized protein LOC112516167 [Cynara cardunculus var. scolymus]
MPKLEEMMVIQIRTVDHFFSYFSKAIAKEGETESGAALSNAVAAAEPAAVPATQTKVEAHPKAEVEVADENPTSCEALVVEDVDVVRAGVEAHDEDLPIISTANAGDMEDDDEDDEDDEGEDSDSSDLPNAGEDLGNDDDEYDDDHDFTVQYQRPSGTTKCIALSDSAFQGEQREKEKETQEKNQNTKFWLDDDIYGEVMDRKIRKEFLRRKELGEEVPGYFNLSNLD